MKANSKRMLCLMLAIVLCVTAMPLPVLATGDPLLGSSAGVSQTEGEMPNVPDQNGEPALSSSPEAMPNAQEGAATPAPTPAASGASETPASEPTTPTASGPAPGAWGPDEPDPAPDTEEPAEPALSDDLAIESISEQETAFADGATATPGLDVGQDIRPWAGGVVGGPLVRVAFHYQEGSWAAADLSAGCAYYPLAMLEGGNMRIPANRYPGEVPVNTAALKVVLDGELDVTAQATYDPASGMLDLPGRYWGHKVEIHWFCSAAEIRTIPLTAAVSIKTDVGFAEKTHTYSLPSNESVIEIPLENGENVVVAQMGVELPADAYALDGGVLYINASPLGGNLAVTAYAPMPQPRMLARSTRPTTVTHTRSADQIYYGYYTSYYTANGNVAFCLDPTVSGLNAGTYAIDYWLDDPNDFLVKCCYYLYGGPGYSQVRGVFEEPDALWAYGMCHAVASYAYMGSMDAFKGLGDTLTGQLLQVAEIVRSLPAVPDGFACFVYNTGGNNQPLVGWQYDPGSPWEPEPDPDPVGSVAVQKASAASHMTENNPCYSLAGAVFDVYAGSSRVGTITTNANGYGSLSNLPVGEYYLVERTPPAGFAGNDQRYPFTIAENATVNVTVEDIPQNDPATILLKKQDAGTGSAEAQGDASLAGAQFTLKFYKGHYADADNLAGAAPARTWVVETDEDGFAMLHEDYFVSGDALYYNSAGNIPTLPLGTLTIRETRAPEGYLLNDALHIRQITADGSMESVETYNEPAVPDAVIRGGVEVEKWDATLNKTAVSQGDATLAGAVLEIYNRSEGSVVVDEKVYAPGEVVYTLTTDEEGSAATANDLLPYGEYEVIEKTPPVGYLSAGIIRRSFQIRENGAMVSLATSDTAIKNDIIRGNVRIEKWDNETGEHAPQGGATLEGATFEIVNRSQGSVLVQDVLYAPGEVVYSGITDETGVMTTPETFLPYGTYEAREVLPPEGYLATGVLSRFFEIREQGKTVMCNTAENSIRNDPIRGDLEGVKIADGTARRLAGVPFKITSKTTGESHVVVTDRNGQFSTASEWAPHSRNTNAGQTAGDGVWFGDPDTLDDEKGALPYDTYILEEQPCEANADMELLILEVTVYRPNTIIHLGTLTDDRIPQPEIFTTAVERESMGNTAFAAGSITILDTVYYSGLKAGTEYTVKGVLMDKAAGEALLVGESQVTGEKTFRATGESGSVTVEFTFDASALQGKAVVVFETLYLDGKEIAAHTDLNDAEQTITFLEPRIGTTAAGKNGEKTLDVSTETTIVDTVSYSGLIPDQAYELRGTIMDKATGKPLLLDEEEVTADTSFIPEAESGSVQVTFTLDARTLSGKQLVVFESLLYSGREIADHRDIRDEGQTVSFAEPKIRTRAAGKNGEKELSLSASAAIVDTVKYENLAAGQSYTLKGILMDQVTGTPVMVGNKEVTAETVFEPEQSSGAVEVTFIFDAASLKAKEVVVFERLYLGDAEIAAHADIEDKDQTVSFNKPQIYTKAAGRNGEKQFAISKNAIIIDTVKYEGLTIGEKYTLKGALMDKATGKPLLIDGKEVTAATEFTPEKAAGSVEISFTFDATSLKGKEVVVFERLYIGETEIAAHADMEDKDQTVSFTAYAIKITKIDRATNEFLDGAEFILYGEDGEETRLSKDKDGAYIPDEKGSSIISTVEGVAFIKNLADQKYTLREVTVPKGYVGYTEPITFEMEARDTENDPFPVTVYNSPEGHKEGSGAKTGRGGLPMWALYGGIGLMTTAAAVGILFLQRRKMN